jgi:hypothetical protein
MGEGLSGKRKTGFGEVVEGIDQNLLQPGTGKSLPHPAKQALGFAGEVGLDPLNVVGGAVVTNVGRAARAANDVDTVSDFVRTAVRKSALDKGVRNADELNVLEEVGRKVARNQARTVHGGATTGRTLTGSHFGPSVGSQVASELRTMRLGNF